ncbi:MAG: STELLO glycosyltransferase family protein, partial [Solirubrobacterales bacterium]
FMEDVEHEVRGRPIAGKGWKNAYVHFTAAPIWPRGFPLDLITSSLCESEVLGEPQTASCDIQQYLADGDPDVDAIYRLTTESETLFEQGTVLLEPGAVCPFNSQNTLWWPAAFPLLYMPSFVSFRMADTWRSFIAQVCLHARDGWMAFHGPTVRHARHAHSLLADFEQEIPGYLGNQAILRLLSGLELDARMEATGENMQRCYAALVGDGFVPKGELELVELWLEELRAFTERS